MNSAEKRIVQLALAFWLVGLVVRILPWGVPTIETFDVGEAKMPVTEAKPVATGILSNSDSSVFFAGEIVPSESDPSDHPKKKRSKKKKPQVKLPIHINQANLDEICALKGVGPKLAEKILAFRQASGPFKGPSDLQKVQGIGKKKLESILQGVIFD